MDLSRTISEINCDFGRKPRIFPLHEFSAPIYEEIPLVFFLTAVELKKTRMMLLYCKRKTLNALCTKPYLTYGMVLLINLN